jgi:hypothetical protein
LGRGITNRLELTTVLTFARRHPFEFNSEILIRRNSWGRSLLAQTKWPEAIQSSQEQIGQLLQAAGASEIRQAMAVVAGYLGFDLDPESDEAAAIFVNFFDDYNGPVASDVYTFAKDVVHWKQAARNVAVVNSLDTEMNDPRCKLPAEPGIRFLATLYDVRQASALFEVNYADINLTSPDPRMYHFVVSYGQAQALLIWNENHNLMYASGVNFKPNAATQWAKEIFRGLGWGFENHDRHFLEQGDEDEIIFLGDERIPF